MKEKILITSALPYANGPLHFGHIAGAYLPGDVYARFKRLDGCDVLYLCGSDEYGVAIALSAEVAGRTPKQQVDHFHDVIKGFFDTLNISFDHYSRTTAEGHAETVQEFFLDLLGRGHIEAKETLQLFSEKEGRFLADRYVEGACPKCAFRAARGDECPSCGASYEATDLKNPICKLTGSPLTLKQTKHWFLRFDTFKEELLAWISQKSWKPNVMNFARSYIEELKERAITRDSSWGIPVPLEEASGKVLYVWFDAPIGYISAAKEWARSQGDKNLWKEYWLDPKTKLVQFIGKDNIPFHAIFFPAMIMGQSIPYKLVDELPANEFYNLEGKQFSKSEGWMIDLENFFTEFTADQARYAIGANAPETADAEFTWKDFQMRCNAELLGKYGNFVNRVLVFLVDKLGGKIPAFANEKEEDKQFLSKVYLLTEEAKEAFDSFHLRKACQILMEIAQAGNVYFDHKKPWQLAKEEEKQQELRNVLRACLECIKCLCLVSAPIIPGTAKKVWGFLKQEALFENLLWDEVVNTPLKDGTVLEKPSILFAKVEDSLIAQKLEELKQLPSKKKTFTASPLKEKITIDEVSKLDLRVAQIKQVERVSKSKKLLKLQVDIGLEMRQIVAGIGENIEDISSLIGKKVVIVANLKPAKLMGIESQGMLFAAKGLSGLELPSFFTSEPGSVVS